MKAIQVIAFPYACGSLDSYSELSKVEGIDLIEYELPGRRSRISESFDNLKIIMNEAVTMINFNKPYIIFGHSMGGYIANEFCKYVEDNNLPTPYKLIISGQAPIQYEDARQINVNISKGDIKEYMSLLGGTPDEVLKNDELLNFYSEIFYQDILFIRKYKKENVSKVITSKLEVWYGQEDKQVSEEKVKKWIEYAESSCIFKKFNGEHFFIDDLFKNPDLTLRHICY